jgi:Zn-dependent protease
VVLHELGHALTARRYGIRTRDIILLPIGGVARLERMPDDPRQELVVALAGPAVNVVLAAIIYIGLALGRGLETVDEAARVGGGYWDRLYWVNVSLAVFNLIPAFPMDGGRVLRALLAMRMDYVRATQAAARVGQALALVFGFLGFFGNPFLILIALFVWLGASAEAGMTQVRSALDGIPIRRVMVTDFHVLHPDDRLSRAVEFLLGGFQQDFPVVEGDRLMGVLTRNDLTAALARYGPDVQVGNAMQKEFVTADPRDMLQSALERLQDCGCHTLPVVQDGRLVGLLTADHLAEVLMIREALHQSRRLRHAPDRERARHRDGFPLRSAAAPSPHGHPADDTANVWAGNGSSKK